MTARHVSGWHRSTFLGRPSIEKDGYHIIKSGDPYGGTHRVYRVALPDGMMLRDRQGRRALSFLTQRQAKEAVENLIGRLSA